MRLLDQSVLLQRRTSDIKRAYLDSLFNFQAAFASLEEIVGEPLGP